MQVTKRNQYGVSEVVGEMLMIAIVLIIVAVFSASLSNYLPSERSPNVEIRLTNTTDGHIILWHKGGDWVKTSTLKVIISNESTSGSVSYTQTGDRRFFTVPAADAFDLGDNLTVDWGGPLAGNESVTLATDRAVIFSGKIGGGTQ